MIFLFPRWDMLIPWRVSTLFLWKIFDAFSGEVQETANGDHRGHGSLGELGEEDGGFNVYPICSMYGMFTYMKTIKINQM